MLAAPLDFGDGENDVDGDTASEVSAQPTAKKVLVAVLFILIMTLLLKMNHYMYRNTYQRPVFSVGILGTFSNDLHSIVDLHNKWGMFVTLALLITYLFEFCPWQ